MKKAILVVSFGTTYPDTLEKTIGATEKAIADAFPGWEVRRAFTSSIIMKKLLKRDGVHLESSFLNALLPYFQYNLIIC